MLYLIGLGLGDLIDITPRADHAIRKCDDIYLEAYTSVSCVGQAALEKHFGRSIKIADRELVEGDDTMSEIISNAATKDVAFLVIGDALGATTHIDLFLRARKKNVQVKLIHNTSIITAVLCCGLQSYSWGPIVSIPYWTDSWQPDSFYDKLVDNLQRNLHTLCLLDIKVKEPTLESLTKKKREYMPSRFMSVAEAAKQLISIIGKRQNSNQELVLTEDSLAVGLARVGSDDQQIIVCTLKEMSSVDLGPPLHSLVILAKQPHPLEIDCLELFALNKNEFRKLIEQQTS
ncbi:Similar to DPH5: Diphthine methyl ester synthase (Homo sapiens) [Cotesia congregata]|uniref:diphthine methyl ester synthase n=1 Tax=Cotesia congregata TaxID=51543 RepID=A0A8J2MRK3_COTCN|nr:Similar to DPH5: Diphthine methyl ester synthase (Homo sapiens) [Cotesia congregata]